MSRTIAFTKMQGAGNDFIIIEARKGLDLKKLARSICHRTLGVGADGLLILAPSRRADLKMRIINADGSEAEMCGNGVRCLAAYVVKNKKIAKDVFTVETRAGKILAHAKGERAVVRLSAPQDYCPKMTLTISKRKVQVHYIDTGVPHVVVFVDQLPKIDVATIGRQIRSHKKFAPRGTNVNFAEQIKPGRVAVRTYERGVEDETRACGTGSVATALIAYLKGRPPGEDVLGASMDVLTASGEILKVTFDYQQGVIENVFLNGSAIFIAEGTFYY